MKNCFRLIFFLVLIVMSSCTLEKRHYRHGYYVDWNSKSDRQNLRSETDSAPLQVVDASGEPELISCSAEPVTIADTASAQQEISRSESVNEFRKSIRSDDRVAEKIIDDPLPEEHDKINRLVGWLTGSGIVLSSVWIGLYFVTIPGSAWLAFVILPILGVLLFALALYFRKRYQAINMVSNADKIIPLSGHYHRFRVLLYLFFGSAAMMAVGWLISMAANFAGAGIFGVILGGGGMILLQGVLAVLLVMFLLYLFLWRKDPTGTRPRRDPHPRKDH